MEMEMEMAEGEGGRSRKGRDIAERLLALGAAAVGLARTVPRDASSRHVAAQLMRSATIGGANYEEARAAESRADFVHKIGIAAKELRETVYWLRLIHRTKMSSTEVLPLIKESDELVAILVASARTARANGVV